MSGFLPNGGGAKGARYGRCTETNRAYKADGTVRKARVTKTPEQRLEAIGAQERSAYAGIGRKVLGNVAALAGFLAAFGTFRRWTREAKSFGTPEARQARIDALNRSLAQVEAKGEMAETFLAEQSDAIEQANGVFSAVGEAYSRFYKSAGRPPDEAEVEAIVAERIDADAIKAVQAASDPESDPFATLRRDAPDEAPEADEDDDTL